MTRAERIAAATSIASASCVHSSTIVRHLMRCPFAQESKTKSYAQTWFGPVAGADAAGSLQRAVAGACGAPAGPRAARAGTLDPGSSDSLRDRAHPIALATGENANPTVAVARILRGELAHAGLGVVVSGRSS